MNCTRAESSFSAYVEADLTPVERRRIDEHLAVCDRCRVALQDLRDALGALGGLTPPPTTPAVRAALLGAVDEDADRRVRGETFERAALLGQVEGTRRARRRGRRSGALLGAAAAAIVAWILWPVAGSEVPSTLPSERAERAFASGLRIRWEGETVNRELRPGDVLTSDALTLALDEQGALEVDLRLPEPRIVERPVEVVRTVEKPVVEEVVVPRVVRRGPLVTLDTEPLARALRGIGRALAARAPSGTPGASEPPALASAPLLADPATGLGFAGDDERATVRVRSDEGRVRLETRGSLDQLVPLLLGRLHDEDAQLVGLVQRHLARIRARAHANPELSGTLLEPAAPRPRPSALARLFGSASEAPARSFADEWAEWWRLNGERVAAAETGGVL